MKQLLSDYIDAVSRWDKTHRLVGETPTLQLYNESRAALESMGAWRGLFVDVGCGAGILGMPWLLEARGPVLFIDPDPKKIAFLLVWLSQKKELAGRWRAINSTLENVSRETIEQFADGEYRLACRAFSGAIDLARVAQNSQFRQDFFWVFKKIDLDGGKAEKFVLEATRF